MNNKATTYFLSGKAYSQESLIQYAYEKLASADTSKFERELYTFIKEWFSSTKYIIAKTSGSTGKPKEIRLLKKHMMASAKTTISFFGLNRGDKILLCLPLTFIAGKMMVVRALVGGLNLYISELSSNPEIPEFQIQFSAMVPLQVANLLKENSNAFTHMEKLIIGGSFLPDSMPLQLQNFDTQVWQTYGMTETMTHIAVRKLNGPDKSELYKTLPGSSVSIDNGRIVIHASHLGISMLKTNDLAEINESGKFRIIGRSDHVIISGGLKFYPEEIEHKLSGIVKGDYFIGSLNDQKLGQRLVLFIEKGATIDRQIFNIWRKLEEKLDKHEMPKEIIFLLAFVKTTSGKIDRMATIGQYEMVSF